MRKILVTSLLTLLGALLLLDPSVKAADGPLQNFAVRMKIVRERVDTVNKNVIASVIGQDWARWCSNHDTYMRELQDAQRKIEEATSTLLTETLGGGGSLSGPTIEAMDLAATQAANYARVRVIIHAYGRFTRYHIPPHKRKEALDLLKRQGVYEQDAGAGGVAATAPTRPSPGLMDSPMTGRIPGSPEASQYLTQWQSAVMKANAAAQRLAGFRAELASMPAEHEMRSVLEQRASAAGAQYDRLIKEATEMRRLYFQVGGK